MSVTHHYPVSVVWQAGRQGVLTSSELTDTITVATPPEFPQGVPNVWSPEHLFVAAVNSCLMTTFLAIAENSRLNFIHFTSHASGKLEMVDNQYRISEVTLMPVVTITDDSQRERALRVLQKAEAACLISNSITSKIIFDPEITVAPATVDV